MNESPIEFGTHLNRPDPEPAALTPPAADPTAVMNGPGRTCYDGALQRYLGEIGNVKLLTAHEEVELAARIKAGDKAARERMINANLRLVVKIARDYEGFGVPLLDLISEGNIGLMQAVDRFDPAKGAKFATYGVFWIKQAIRRGLTNQSKIIRLPAHMVEQISKMSRAEQLLEKEFSRRPNDEELAEELGVKTARIVELRLAAGTRPTSLDAPIGHEDSSNFGDIVEDESAQNPADRFQEAAAKGVLQDLVTKLKPREANILRARFGLDGAAQSTLDEISVEFGVTRERVRQIQDAALRKLRKMFRRLEKSEPQALSVQAFAL
jgi:RNA polymerase primary sigma factor